MGELPLWHKQEIRIGAAALPMQRKSLCLSGEVAGLVMFDFNYRKADMGAVLVKPCADNRTNAGLDIIASYARNCGKQPSLNAAGTFFLEGHPVLCAIRENIRKSDGVYANAAADADGAKEIDCYV
ncbi:hypothetical protein ACQZ6F_16740 [Rhizobium sp. A22-96]